MSLKLPEYTHEEMIEDYHREFRSLKISTTKKIRLTRYLSELKSYLRMNQIGMRTSYKTFGRCFNTEEYSKLKREIERVKEILS